MCGYQRRQGPSLVSPPLLCERHAVPVQTRAVDAVSVNGSNRHVIYVKEVVETRRRHNRAASDANHDAPEFVLICSGQVGARRAFSPGGNQSRKTRSLKGVTARAHIRSAINFDLSTKRCESPARKSSRS